MTGLLREACGLARAYRASILLAGLAGVAAGCSQSAESSPAAPTSIASTEARPSPSASVSMTVGGATGCDFTVTYTWSGQKGRNLIASFGVYERVGGLDWSLDLQNVSGQSGSGGSVTHTFQLTPNAEAGRLIVARGSLYETRRNTQIAESSAVSPNSVFSTCG